MATNIMRSPHNRVSLFIQLKSYSRNSLNKHADVVCPPCARHKSIKYSKKSQVHIIIQMDSIFYGNETLTQCISTLFATFVLRSSYC